jgi:Transcription factor PAP1
MMQFHDYTQHNPRNASVGDDGHNYFDCPKVWERIVSHPRFDQVDVEALCAALNAKVRIVWSLFSRLTVVYGKRGSVC